VVLRYDPRDMAEVRLFYRNKFLCRAICRELAGQTVALRDIRLARDQRRSDLRATLRERRETVESLLELRRGSPPALPSEPLSEQKAGREQGPALRRYRNE
jgi:putative transposase